MQNGNKQPHWKEKLNDASLLSAGQALNTEVSWEVLQHRLQNRTRRRKARLYWVAAACLLPLFFMLSLPFFQTKNVIVKSVIHHNPVTKPSVPDAALSQSESAVTTLHETMVKRETTSSHSRKKMTGIDKKIESGLSVKDSAVPEETIASLPPDDSIFSKPVIAAVQQKKKLPVVHINDLNEPVVIMPVIAHNSDRRFFPLQIARGEITGKEIKTVHTTSFISLKTKRSSN